MPTTFKFATHTKTGQQIVEVWEGDEFIAAIYPTEHPRTLKVFSGNPIEIEERRPDAFGLGSVVAKIGTRPVQQQARSAVAAMKALKLALLAAALVVLLPGAAIAQSSAEIFALWVCWIDEKRGELCSPTERRQYVFDTAADCEKMASTFVVPGNHYRCFKKTVPLWQPVR